VAETPSRTPGPQLAGCCDQSSPNFESLVLGIRSIRTKTREIRGAYYSLIWLKAFGVQAIAMDGAASTEAYQPFCSSEEI